MTPAEYEEFIRQIFAEKGYITKLTSYSNDYGIDIFALKEKEKIGIQVKMFGHSTRKINRQMVMELYGAKAYFNCTKAILATDGEIIENALEVANKLGIEILFEKPGNVLSLTPLPSQTTSRNYQFDAIWTDYIKKLEGKTLVRSNGKTNKILKVDWSGIERITSNGKKQKIKIEIFRLSINKILSEGSITRSFINQEYKERASSGVVLILSQVPFFDIEDNPSRIVLNKGKNI